MGDRQQQYLTDLNDLLDLVEASYTKTPEEYAALSQQILGRWTDRGDDPGRLLYFACQMSAGQLAQLGTLRGHTFDEEMQAARVELMNSADGLDDE